MTLLLPLTAHEAASVLNHLSLHPLPPTSAVFPWLHSGAAELAPKEANGFLYFVRSCPVANHGSGVLPSLALLRHSISPKAALLLPDTSDRRAAISSLLLRLHIVSNAKDPLIDQIVADCQVVGLFPRFQNPRPTDIRAFHMQLSRLVRVADLVVYCFNKDHLSPDAVDCKCASVSRLLGIAQLAEAAAREQKPLPYACYDDYDDIQDTTDSDDNIDFAQVLAALAKNPAFSDSSNAVNPSTPRSASQLLADPNAQRTFVLQNPVDILRGAEPNAPSDLRVLRPLLSVPPFDEQGARIQTVSRLYNSDVKPALAKNMLSEYEVHSLRNPETTFRIKEKFEIWKISLATCVHEGVWVGNEGDYFMWRSLFGRKAPLTVDSYTQPYPPSVPPYCDLHNSFILQNSRSYMRLPLFPTLPFQKTLLNEPQTNWRMFILVNSTMRMPPLSMIMAAQQSMENPTADQVVYLGFPAAGLIAGLGNLSIQSILAIINMCKLLYYKDHQRFPLLVYCPEGYTETSLFMVIYLVYATGRRVQEVVFDYHIELGRPFYLFTNDYILLRELEPILLCYSPKRPELKWGSILSARVENLERGPELESLTEFTSELISDILITGYNCSSLNSYESWFEALLERAGLGSVVPSRITPNVYLGTLSHADSVPLLARLRISTVVSVGECVSWLLALPEGFVNTTELYSKQVGNFKTSLKLITFNKASQISLSLKEFPLDRILVIQGVKDDGMDTISTELFEEICKFFDNYTDTNPESIVVDLPDKILVHCKVGVSRSATVVICYLMRYLGMTLEAAYLYVRVRRLNIVIQPNLRLAYELFKFQEKLLQQHIEEEKSLDYHRSNGLAIFSNGNRFRRRKQSNVSETSSESSSVPQGLSSRGRQWSVTSSLQRTATSESFTSNSSEDEDPGKLESGFELDSRTPSTATLVAGKPVNTASPSSGSLLTCEDTSELFEDTMDRGWLRTIDWGLFGFQVDNLNDFGSEG